MSLVAFPIIMEMDFILRLWLKEFPEGTVPFCQLMILGCLIGCMGEGIPALTQASGKIKYFQLILSSIALLGLPISYVCYSQNAVSYSILIVYCVISFIVAFIRLVLLKYILNISVRVFFMTSYFRIILISIPLIVLFQFYDSTKFSTIEHMVALFYLEIYLLIDIFVLGIDNSEKKIIRKLLKK